MGLEPDPHPNFVARNMSLRFPLVLSLNTLPVRVLTGNCDGFSDSPRADNVFAITIDIGGIPVCTSILVNSIQNLEVAQSTELMRIDGRKRTFKRCSSGSGGP